MAISPILLGQGAQRLYKLACRLDLEGIVASGLTVPTRTVRVLTSEGTIFVVTLLGNGDGLRCLLDCRPSRGDGHVTMDATSQAIREKAKCISPFDAQWGRALSRRGDPILSRTEIR
jgi:hypothetical protein